MNYHQTLEHLYAQLPMFSRIGSAAYKEDLHNTLGLCKALGDPQQKFKTIHVAGTNGKGSTSHMLAAMLQKAGYKTGLYTSPHLKDFGERIRINGEMISEDFVVDFVERTQTITETIQPSFFELTVAMAFDYFAKEKVDIAVIETGLGGRLDSTNIIAPILSVITNIGYDHMNILGNTLEKIAAEKAGIIKKNTPVVVGEYLPETISIFKNKAAEMNADVYFAQDIYKAENISFTNSALQCSIIDSAGNSFGDFTLDLNGIYQVKNLCTVIAAKKILVTLGFKISTADEKYALANVKQLTGLRGRWDIINSDPLTITDVAHNEDGIKQVLWQLKDQYPSAPLHFVLGFVKDKDVTKVLKLFPRDAAYYFTNAHAPRALRAPELQEMAASAGLNGNAYDDVNKAISAAKTAAKKDAVIMVCGSFFTIAEIE